MSTSQLCKLIRMLLEICDTGAVSLRCVFTARCYAVARLCHGKSSVRPSVRPFVCMINYQRRGTITT